MASEFFVKSNVVFGKDAVKKLPDIINEYEAKNVMVVYDAGVKMAGIAEKVLKEIAKTDVKVTICRSNPESYKRSGRRSGEDRSGSKDRRVRSSCGGSSIDLRKAVNILMTTPALSDSTAE